VSRSGARKAQLVKIEMLNESLDEAYRVIIGDVIIERFRKEPDFRTRSALNEAQWVLPWKSYANICSYDQNGY